MLGIAVLLDSLWDLEDLCQPCGKTLLEIYIHIHKGFYELYVISIRKYKYDSLRLYQTSIVYFIHLPPFLSVV